MLVNIIITLSTFSIMEFISWATHKYVMHGFLWILHEDHHKVDRNKIFQKNDYFFLIFAIPSFLLILFGSDKLDFKFFIGIGIALYGLAYFIIHEIIIHQRIPFLKNTKIKYFRILRKAHKIHHKIITKKGCSCFGMLIVPKKYW